MSDSAKQTEHGILSDFAVHKQTVSAICEFAVQRDVPAPPSSPPAHPGSTVPLLSTGYGVAGT
eukprot:1870646-Rhodomonas_salina.1